MRWGKPTKNTRRTDPRYFLYEQQEQDEKEFLDLFTKVGNEISDEELLGFLNEAEDPAPLEKTQGQELYLSEETRKYIINWTRRRIVQVGSIKLRTILAITTKSTLGTALAALYAAGFGPKRLWRMTSTDYLDKKIERALDRFYPRGKGTLYPGATDIKTLLKATFQSVMRMLKSDAVQKVEALPEADREALEQEVKEQLEEIGGHPVEIDLSASKTQALPAEEVPEEAPTDSGWEDWDKKRIDPDRYKNNPLYRKLVKKVQGGK